MNEHHYIVTVTYDEEYKLYSARCEALPGMFVDCETLEEVFDVVPWAVKSLVKDTTDTPSIPLYMVDLPENRIY